MRCVAYRSVRAGVGQMGRHQHSERRCTMRNHDLVSDGFLAVVAASLVLLCSGLLAIAFS